MTMSHRLAVIFVLLSSGISLLWGWSLGRTISGGPIDFQAIYYGSRCLIQHHNPYSVAELEMVYRNAGGETPSDTQRHRHAITLYVNLPATFLVVAPFSLMPLGIAQILWMTMTAASLTLAGFLMWDLGAKHAPVLAPCLVGLLLANCQFLFATGNTAGIVVGLCVVGAWCFLRERFLAAGILCLAVSLAMKPHDAGLVWLFFLLAGGVHRRRALQTLAVTAALTLAAALWVSSVAPHWMHDWQTNMTAISAPGGLNDPRPGSVPDVTAGSVICLQSVFSIFRDDSRIYNLASYLVCAALLLVWTVATLRSRWSNGKALLALASIMPVTILVTYHRVYDTRLLLLTIPACALLWAGGGLAGNIAVVLNVAAIFLCGDIPLTVLSILTNKLDLSTATLSGKFLTVLLARPDQEILFTICIFYLWVYVRHSAPGFVDRLEGRSGNSISRELTNVT